MDVKDDYFLYFILSLFKDSSNINSGQIENVFRGRKTPTILYITEKNKWFPAYGLLPKVERTDIDKCLKILHNNEWIVKTEEGFDLTTEGKMVLDDYFKSHIYPSSINKISSPRIRKDFFERFQFLTQIFSEKRYNNQQYSPVSKSPKMQSWIKIFMKQIYLDMDNKTTAEDIWIEENIHLFSKLSESGSSLLAKLLTGHEVLGRTFTQVMRENEWTKTEFYVLLHNAIEELIKIIESEDMIILEGILKEVQKENFYGLSKSAFRTAVYIGKNYSIDTIAVKRRLKSNTIKEHILEIAFIQNDFIFSPFIPRNIYLQLNQLFDNKKRTFKEAKETVDNLEFMHFRLVELERLRET